MHISKYLSWLLRVGYQGRHRKLSIHTLKILIFLTQGSCLCSYRIFDWGETRQIGLPLLRIRWWSECRILSIRRYRCRLRIKQRTFYAFEGHIWLAKLTIYNKYVPHLTIRKGLTGSAWVLQTMISSATSKTNVPTLI